jgi:pimeloyl-ACP methyl ester carboxylesterase
MLELNYKQYGDQGKDIIILHGLFGSLDNWQTIAKSMSEKFKVWTIDQRNHGRSPHTGDISYRLMADDVLQFMEEHQIRKASIIGHSMGGKVAMTFALLYPERVDKLIVADIGPVVYQGDHLPLFEAMLQLPLDQIAERSEADDFLTKTITSFAVRQFLLKNLGRDNNGFFWKPNLPLLYEQYAHLMGFDSMGKQFTGPVYFLKGSKSAYINPAHLDYYKSIFPQAEIKVIEDVGHWLHAEQPERFLEVVKEILVGLC